MPVCHTLRISVAGGCCIERMPGCAGAEVLFTQTLQSQQLGKRGADWGGSAQALLGARVGGVEAAISAGRLAAGRRRRQKSLGRHGVVWLVCGMAIPHRSAVSRG